VIMASLSDNPPVVKFAEVQDALANLATLRRIA
jgi:hypothetical protein